MMGISFYCGMSEALARKVLFFVIGFGLGITSWNCISAEPDVGEPGVEGSHQKFMDQVEGDKKAGCDVIIEIYEKRLIEAPKDLVCWIEFCKFLDLALYDYELEENPLQARFDEVFAKLLNELGEEPLVQIYRCGRLFGAELFEAVDELEREGFEGWEDKERAAVYEFVAWSHFHSGNSSAASDAALRAIGLNADLALGLVIADGLLQSGDEAKAREVLLASSMDGLENWQIGRIARLLSLIGEDERAVQWFERLESEKYPFSKLDYTRSLERTGSLEKARGVLLESVEQYWKGYESRVQLFDFDLRHRSAEETLASYRRLRDFDDGDPWLRYRLALLLRYPLLPWDGADLGGMVSLALVVFLLGMLPLVVIAPIHHFGLWRRVKGRPLSVRVLSWSLRHFWLVSFVYLLAFLGCMYWFEYEGWSGFLNDENGLDFSVAAENLVPIQLVSSAAMLLVAIACLGRSKWSVLTRNHWSGTRSFLIVLLCFVFFTQMTRTLAWLSSELAGGLPEVPLGWALLAETSMTFETLLALGESFGIGCLVLFLVVIVPFYEEVIFRGCILDALEGPLPFHFANLIQATIFALIHEKTALFVFYLAVGLVSGLLRRDSGGLRLSIVLHMLINSVGSAQLVKHILNQA